MSALPTNHNASGYECAQAAGFSRLEEKMDKLAEAVNQIAVQNHRITALEEYCDDHEGRIRNLESAPAATMSRLLWALVGGLVTTGVSVLVALIVYQLGVK